ncbi:chemotaxis protein CheB [Dyadobacter sp. CY312]|uniref:chemotaxis protein CheB n=1 Tax=Dyadobacter sp. CY312 TaxID=2907303 RepID=UPI001F2D3A42|nr:chemotaxis protein CheB [Dyadobacter sp. CY312]MCE7038855.1 chemotaxis protein CheB [Dyadobacter sp. CY312]
MEESGVKNPVKIVVIGGSAGSLEVLFRLLPLLTKNLSVPILIILHRRSTADSSLSDLLGSKTTLPLQEADDKDQILPGNIYLAPADYHLLVEKDFTLSLDYSEKVNFSRPSLDVTFETVADVYGRSAVGIILSGANEDGTAGLLAIKKAGGLVIAQDPETAQMPVMPQNVINFIGVDFIYGIEEIANYINGLNTSGLHPTGG